MSASLVLLNTKLVTPRLGPQAVPRPRPIQQLRAALDVRLTLLSAPAGFGKTTLVAEWLDQLAAPSDAPRPAAAWLTLDEFDNDPAHFWSYVLAALEVAPAAPPGLRAWAAALQRALGSTLPPPLDSAIAALLNELAQLPVPLVLVLDDYQHIRAPVVHDGLHYFLAHLPRHVHVVLLTRVDPPLPLNRLRAQGQLFELRAADLCFTEAEIDALLSRRLRMALPPEAIAAVAARTDGWPAGLQLLALSLQGRAAADVLRFIETFTGSNRYIVDYLLEEVLQNQPEPVREFLLRTSLLDRFSAELCDELWRADEGLGEPGALRSPLTSSAILHLLETENLFLISLDDNRVWHRYYHLFAEALQEELRRRSPELEPLLHRCAGAWYAKHHLYREAVEHTLAGGDWENAADQLTVVAQPLLVAGEFALLNRWFAQLPPEVASSRPRLSLTHGWLLLFHGPLVQVEADIASAAAMLTRAPGPLRGDARTIPGELGALRAMLASFRWDVEATVALCAEAERLLPEGDDFSRGVVAHALGHAHQLSGDYDAATATYLRAITFCERLGSAQLAAFPTFRLAHTYLLQGRLALAAQTYRRGLKTITDHGGAHWPVAADAYIGLADIARQRNELAAAEGYVQRGLALAPRRSAEMLVFGLAVQAAIRLAAGKGEDARTLIREAVHAARDYHNDGLLAWATAELARIEIALGRLEAAVQWTEMAGAHATGTGFIAEWEAVTAAYLYLAQGRPRAALALLAEREAQAVASNHQRSLVETLVLQAAAHSAVRQGDAAAAALQRALALAEPEGMRRVFLDEGARLRPLLQSLAHAAEPAPFARELVGLIDAGVSGEPLQPDAPLDHLTPRELEILRLIARGASNRQIAATFVLTVGTVKGHVNHILSKLDARNRTEAVARARDMGLL